MKGYFHVIVMGRRALGLMRELLLITKVVPLKQLLLSQIKVQPLNRMNNNPMVIFFFKKANYLIELFLRFLTQISEINSPVRKSS